MPIISGSYIYLGDMKPPDNILRDMIWVVKGSADFDLDDKKVLLDISKIPVKLKDRLELEDNIEEVWKKLSLYTKFGIYEEKEDEGRILDLFLSLNKSDSEIYRRWAEVKSPQAVVVSSLLTMILKAQSHKEYRGYVSPAYLKSLELMGRILKGVRNKFIRYYLSDRSELQFLHLLFSLKR